MKSGDDLVFNDAFVEGLLDNPEKPKNAVVDFNYSPERGRIARFESLIRCRMISELYLVGQKISDLSFMENLINLVRVDLAWNEVESIVPLTKLPKLEYANLNHNAIEVIPKSISALSNLKILHLGFNKVSERSMLQHLKLNLNLWSLDLEGSTISCDPDSLLFCVYLLPQLGMLNRTIIDLDTRKKALDRFDRRTVEELTEANERLMDECNSLKHVATELRMQLKDESLDDKSAAKVIKQLREENARLVKYGESQEQKIAHLKEKSREMKRSYEELREKMINAESTRQYEPVSLQLRLQEMEIKCEDIRKQLEDKINENEQLSTQLEASRVDASEAKKKASSKVNKMKSQWGETKQELASARQEIETLKDELQRETNANAEEKMSLMSKIENISRKNQTLIEENAEMKRQCDHISQQASGLKYQDKSESHTIKEHFAGVRELARLGIPVEMNDPNQWSSRLAHDTIIVTSYALISAVMAMCGVSDMVLQMQFNKPKETGDYADLAKMQAGLNLATRISKISSKPISLYRETRTGIESLSPDMQKAKWQLARSTLLQMCLEPHIIHIVSYCEANYAARPEDIIDSSRLIRRAVKIFHLYEEDIKKEVANPIIKERKEYLEHECEFFPAFYAIHFFILLDTFL